MDNSDADEKKTVPTAPINAWNTFIRDQQNEDSLNDEQKALLSSISEKAHVPRRRNKFKSYLRFSCNVEYSVSSAIWDILQAEFSKIPRNEDSGVVSKKVVKGASPVAGSNGKPNNKNHTKMQKNKSKGNNKKLSKEVNKPLTNKRSRDEVSANNPEAEELPSKKMNKGKGNNRKLSKDASANKRSMDEVLDVDTKKQNNPNNNKKGKNKTETVKAQASPKKKQRKSNARKGAAMNNPDLQVSDATRKSYPYPFESVILKLLKKSKQKAIPLNRLHKKILSDVQERGFFPGRGAVEVNVKVRKKLRNGRLWRVSKDVVYLKDA